jgi:hypothetical protein
MAIWGLKPRYQNLVQAIKGGSRTCFSLRFEPDWRFGNQGNQDNQEKGEHLCLPTARD